MQTLEVVSQVKKEYQWNDWYYRIQQVASKHINYFNHTIQSVMSKEKDIRVAFLFQDELPDFIQPALYPALEYMEVRCIAARSVSTERSEARWCELVLPLRSCETSYINWPIDKLQLRKPTLIRTDIGHWIDNSANPFNRYTVNFGFKDNPTFDYIDGHLTPP